jgi:hypothetical protein
MILESAGCRRLRVLWGGAGVTGRIVEVVLPNGAVALVRAGADVPGK